MYARFHAIPTTLSRGQPANLVDTSNINRQTSEQTSFSPEHVMYNNNFLLANRFFNEIFNFFSAAYSNSYSSSWCTLCFRFITVAISINSSRIWTSVTVYVRRKRILDCSWMPKDLLYLKGENSCFFVHFFRTRANTIKLRSRRRVHIYDKSRRVWNILYSMCNVYGYTPTRYNVPCFTFNIVIPCDRVLYLSALTITVLIHDID